MYYFMYFLFFYGVKVRERPTCRRRACLPLPIRWASFNSLRSRTSLLLQATRVSSLIHTSIKFTKLSIPFQWRSKPRDFDFVDWKPIWDSVSRMTQFTHLPPILQYPKWAFDWHPRAQPHSFTLSTHSQLFFLFLF